VQVRATQQQQQQQQMKMLPPHDPTGDIQMRQNCSCWQLEMQLLRQRAGSAL